MKLPREYLCAWKDVVAEFLASVGLAARRARRSSNRVRRAMPVLSRKRPTSRSGRPLLRLAGFESLEPRMDVCTFWFNAESGRLFITGSDGETIGITDDGAGHVQLNGNSTTFTSISAAAVKEIVVATGGGSNSVYLASIYSNIFVALQDTQVLGHGNYNEVYGSSGYNVLTASDNGYGGGANYNTLYGSGGTDVLNAQNAGSDSYNLLWGLGGNETLNGGAGENDLIGNESGEINTLNGGSGTNYLGSMGGISTLNGGSGDNTLDGYGGGVNVLNAGSGNNTLYGD
ncbi:MAG TPA: calcium-binding protein, partial [Pirellulales bacterium]|nr:calcium-binding protein [Pirellulales bacterium]